MASVHSRIINQAKRLAVFKINKASRKGRETGRSDQLVFKAADSAASAGTGAEQSPERRKETDADRMEAWGRGRRNADVAGLSALEESFMPRLEASLQEPLLLLGATQPQNAMRATCLDHSTVCHSVPNALIILPIL